MLSLTPRTSKPKYSPGAAAGGGGGGTTFQSGVVALVAAQQSYAIAFSPAFASPPTKLTVTVEMPGSSGELFFASVDKSTITINGCTAWLSGLPTAASSGGQIRWEAAL